MRASPRADRVGDEIREIVASTLLLDAGDPRLQELEVTGVRVSSDLSTARVFWVPVAREVPTEGQVKQFARALASAAGFLRGRVAQRLRLRHTPELSFEFDESVERGRRMERLLSTLDIPNDAD
jgi:ribosome-binding factor A